MNPQRILITEDRCMMEENRIQLTINIDAAKASNLTISSKVLPAADVYRFIVAAGVPPAVEPGILPGGLSCGFRRHFRVPSSDSGRQDAALYGNQDRCRYSRKAALNKYTDVVGGAGGAEP